jgi:U4/U6 small nuclear ribonucleoprotein PRP3
MAKKLEKAVEVKKPIEIKKPKVEKPDNTYVDPRIGQKMAARSKRSMVFHDAGKFQDEANRLRMKAQLEKLQSDISSIARKTGISSATQLAKLVPRGDKEEKEPEIEWWDQLLIGSTNYENWVVRPGAISNLIEHPIQLRPMESSRPVHVPMFLTKREHKKLRRQNRREAWKEKQDKIRLGLVAPDEPKVKMSNLMRVLGNEQILDPTKIEQQVRTQMAK